MLVLTRKRSEKILIGDNIVIKVIKAGRNTVKIGIEAPSDVRVLREELIVARQGCTECEASAEQPALETAAVEAVVEVEEDVEDHFRRPVIARSLIAAAG